MRTKPAALMFQGTGSDVGKTVLVAGLCRVAKRRGLRVVPFKPQNMSNNAAVADADAPGTGGEIGRAQWLQALACGVAPSVHMNPILLKPQSMIGSQVIVQGKMFGSATARDYQKLKPRLLEAVLDSYRRVASSADLVLVEGAGSPAEINLRQGDVANMGFAVEADVPVIMVGDIDRGGVIASLVGTHTILPEEDRSRIVGFMINKFRGDVSLFDDGLRSIEAFTGWPSLGVLPWLDVVRRLPAEDSVALDRMSQTQGSGLKISVPLCGKIANFDDLDPLRSEPDVNLVFVEKGQDLPPDSALVVLPGSKSTIADLMEFRANGWDVQLQRYVEKGGHVVGLCGGYQMLGRTVSDPKQIEGSVQQAEGLGLLNVDTELMAEKQTSNWEAFSTEFRVPLQGYEIHVGYTDGPDCARPMTEIDGRVDGAMSSDGRIQGCYLHGLFHSDAYRKKLLEKLGSRSTVGSFAQTVEDALDSLAAAMEQHLDIDQMLNLAGLEKAHRALQD